MSSIAGWLGVAAGGPYSASKFALEGMIVLVIQDSVSWYIANSMAVQGQ